jgi:hypothetical protein
MWLRRTLAVFTAIGLTLAPTVAPAAQASTLTECSSTFVDGDKRLGPAKLPVLGDVGFQLFGYHRTGNLTQQQFLDTYYDPAGNGGLGGWRYPPQNGYVIGPDGKPMQTQIALVPGQSIDRYGSEYGSFLAPRGLPYAARAIPPQSLVGVPAAACNYHQYRVIRTFSVDSGPIAAWFAQPGGGLQYQLDATLVSGAPPTLNVMWLLGNGYLDRVK